MNNRILIYVAVSADCMSFRIMSGFRKFTYWFYILRSSLIELERKTEIIVHDINSFAVLHRDINTETIEINFTWLLGDKDNVLGYKEVVILSYHRFIV